MKVETAPLLSILIPTRNRQEYAFLVAKHVLKIDDRRLQLIIYDNSDSNKLEALLSHCLTDPRIKYFYNGAVLSFVDNFSLGIGKCEGEYVTIIGDDDGINPLMMSIVDWASKNKIEAISPSLPLVYNWPGSGANLESGNGRLIISEISCEAIFCDSKREVRNFLENGCLNYLSYNLAKVYHGLIKKSVLEKIKYITGKYIGGLSPDIYLSIASSLLVEKVLIIEYPLTISGICKKSGSSDSASGKHTGELTKAPHFIGHENYLWSKNVPAFYSVETIWADSALAAIADLKGNELIRHFRIDILSAHCVKLYPQFRSLIIKNLAHNYNTSVNSLLIKYRRLSGLITLSVKRLAKKVVNKIFNKKSLIFIDVADIERAATIVYTNIIDKEKRIFVKLKSLN